MRHKPPRDSQQLTHGDHSQQRDRLRFVLSDPKEQRTFGIEWVVRLFLVTVQFIYPSLLVRTIAGKFGTIHSHVSVEIYVLAKVLFFALVIVSGIHETPLVVAVVIYLLSETVFYLMSLIFLADLYAPPVSWRRSVLLLLINYLEITLAFAVLYLVGKPLGVTITNPFQGVFFSFITSAGISFGPVYTATATGQVIVVCQICVMIIFLILVGQHVANSLEALKEPSQMDK